MSECCNICLNSGRPVKFVSDRIKICQRCVSLLQDTPINPEKIEEHLLEIVMMDAWMPPKEPDKNNIKTKAYDQIARQESFFESIITSIFYKDKREKKVQELSELMYQRAYAEYCEELKKYQDKFGIEINKNYERLLSGEYMPRELTYFFAKRKSFGNRWSSPFKSAYKDSLDSTDKKYLKYIRAFNLHLLSGDEKSIRPTDEEMQELRNLIKRQDKFMCKICSKSGKGVELHVHHIIPLDKFGTNHPNNLITLCHSCHNKQHKGFQVTRKFPIKRKRTGGEFVAVDIETTGFSANDHIIELAAVKYRAAQPIDEFSTLVNPKVSIPYKITTITGIDDHMVLGAPVIDEIFHEFLGFIGESKLVLHNSPFDMRFLRRYAQEFGCQINNEVVDTLPLSKEKIPQLNNYKLQTLIRHFNIVVNGKHRALADSYATAQVYIACMQLKKPRSK